MRRGAAALLLASVALAAGAAPAHVLFDRVTLRQWVRESAAVVRVEFESDAEMWSAPDGSDRQEFFRVRVVETLAGEVAPGPLEFFPHAEGFPLFARGDRALLFLERTAERPEFASLAPRFAWHSAQGAGQEWRLPAGDEGEAIAEVARRLAALRSAPPSDPLHALREHLVTELASPSARLRRDAIVELMRTDAALGFLDGATVTALAPFADARALPPLERLALIRLLDGAPGFDADARLVALTRERLDERETRELVWSTAQRDLPALRRWVEARADDPRESVRREARAALANARTAAAERAPAVR